MKQQVAQRLLHCVAQAAAERPTVATPEVAVWKLGIAGLLHRLQPDGLAARPESDVVMDHLWSDIVQEAARDASAGLTDAGVTHAVFKGAALLGDVYRSGDVYLSDADVIVPPTELDKAVAVLVGRGFALLDAGGDAFSDGSGRILQRPLPEGAHALPVDVDLHSRLMPVRRLLTWKGTPVPDGVWQGVSSAGPVPVFRPGHHAALLVHHLVRHDFLHFRSLVDLVMMWERISDPTEVEAFLQLAAHLDVGWAGHALCDAVARDLDLVRLPFPSGAAPGRTWGRPALSVEAIAGMALDGTAREFEAITLGRIGRRLGAVDSLGAVAGMALDALLPPDEYLSARWPGASPGARRLKHLGRIIGRAWTP